MKTLAMIRFQKFGRVMQAVALLVAPAASANADSFTLPEIGLQSTGQCRDLAVRDRDSKAMVPLACLTGGKWRLTPDTTAIGAGSTARTLLDRFGERPSVLDYGADPTGVADSTAALTAALNSGKPVTAPCGTFRLVSTVKVTVRAQFTGSGDCTLFKYDAAAGVPVTPALDIQRTAVGSSFHGFRVDHQANTKGYTASTIYGGTIIASSAILVQPDDTALSRVTVDNAFDNGIAVVQFADSGYSPVFGSPKRYSLKTIRTSYCGAGSDPKAGAGVDIATGSFGVVDDLVDIGSYGAFILDIGAGGQGSFSNMTGIYTKVDPALGHSYTFYIGSPNSTFTNLFSQEAQHGGLWLDGFADRTTLTNAVIKGSGAEGVRIQTGNLTISNVVVNSPGIGKPTGTVDAVVVDSTASRTNNLIINGLSVQNEFTTARYGINRQGSGSLTGAAINATFAGAATPTNNLPGTFGVVDGAALGGGWVAYTPTITCETGSLTSSTASGLSRRVGRTVNVQLNLGLTTVGSCSGAISASLPQQAANRSVLMGQETGQTGVGLIGTAYETASTIQIRRYDGTNLSPTSGMSLTFSGTYQAQ